MMKKIMFYFPLIYIGGTEKAVLNLIKKLKGFEIYIGYISEDSDRNMLEEFSKYVNIVNIEKEENIEVDYFISCSMKFHVHEQVKKIKRKKTILWVHQILNLDDSILNSDSVNNIDCVITVSKTIEEYLRDRFSYLKNKILTIYNVIDCDEIIEKSKEEFSIPLSKQLNLVTVSRICEDKGFNRMLALANHLKEACINFKWFVVGNNFNKKEANNIIKRFSEFKENFVWYGFLDNPHKIVKQCDYSILLSKHETWGLVLTEAMCLGVPCISTDFEVAYEQIKDKENGIILSRTNLDSYKDRINEMVSQKEVYKKAVIDFRYNDDIILNEWSKLFNNMIID